MSTRTTRSTTTGRKRKVQFAQETPDEKTIDFQKDLGFVINPVNEKAFKRFLHHQRVFQQACLKKREFKAAEKEWSYIQSKNPIYRGVNLDTE